MYRGYLLTALGREYHKRDLVMQLHIGALRNTSSRMFARLGADTGFDSMGDFSYAASLAGLMDAMDRTDELPKMVLYGLNPQDMDMLAAMAGNFQGNDRGIRGKIQLGSAWWFGDHKDGILRQLKALSSNGLYLLACLQIPAAFYLFRDMNISAGSYVILREILWIWENIPRIWNFLEK